MFRGPNYYHLFLIDTENKLSGEDKNCKKFELQKDPLIFRLLMLAIKHCHHHTFSTLPEKFIIYSEKRDIRDKIVWKKIRKNFVI